MPRVGYHMSNARVMNGVRGRLDAFNARSMSDGFAMYPLGHRRLELGLAHWLFMLTTPSSTPRWKSHLRNASAGMFGLPVVPYEDGFPPAMVSVRTGVVEMLGGPAFEAQSVCM